MASIAALHIYPVKSCAGIELQKATLSSTGFAGDRQWVLVDEKRRFITQRQVPQMALIKPSLQGQALTLAAPGMSPISIAGEDTRRPTEVTVWGDQCAGFDEGLDAAEYLSAFLRRQVRLVRFDASRRRLSNRDWTGDIEAANQFSDGFPLLAISNASLADLNSRLQRPLPMNRFRPNIVLDGLDAYGEDAVGEFHANDIRLRVVKPCTRCKITTTDQASGAADGIEPLQTLRTYRWDEPLKGVMFGQNLIIVAGVGSELSVGQTLQAG